MLPKLREGGGGHLGNKKRKGYFFWEGSLIWSRGSSWFQYDPMWSAIEVRGGGGLQILVILGATLSNCESGVSSGRRPP